MTLQTVFAVTRAMFQNKQVLANINHDISSIILLCLLQIEVAHPWTYRANRDHLRSPALYQTSAILLYCHAMHPNTKNLL